MAPYAIGAFFLLIAFRLYTHFFTKGFWQNEKQGQIVLILFEFPILILSAIHFPVLRQCLEIEPLKKLGALSMDVYLWHVPVQIVFKLIDVVFRLKLNFGSPITWGIYVVSVLVIAIISHHINYSRLKLFRIGIVGIICICLASLATNWLGIKLFYSYEASMVYEANNPIVIMDPDKTLEEYFWSEKTSYVDSIRFYTITWNKPFASDQTLYLEIIDDTGEPVFHDERSMKSISDASVLEVKLSEPVALRSGKEYCLRFFTNTNDREEQMALMLTNDVYTKGCRCVVNNTKMNADISAAIVGRSS